MRAATTARRSGRAALAGLLVAGLAVAGLSPADAAPAAVVGKGADVLSPRLEQLTRAGTRSAPAGTQAAALGLPGDGAGSLLRQDGKLVVDLAATNPAAITAAAALPDVELLATTPEGVVASIAVPASRLASLRGIGGLRSATEVLEPTVHRSAAPTAPAPASRRAATCPSGVVSGGDAQLKAALTRSTYGVDGTGVTVGVISDSFKYYGSEYNADVLSGDLPGPGNPCGHPTAVQVLQDYSSTSASDEGRAMVQIVHDLAPGATLKFASGFVGGDVGMANQIRALRTAGADIIVDDLGYFNELMYQDGVIAKAIDDVVDAGAAYYSAAGNGEVKIGGQPVGSYETPAFRPTTCPTFTDASVGVDNTDYLCHDFDGSAGTTAYDDVTVKPASSGSRPSNLVLSVGWNQRAYDVTSDFDVFLVDTASNAVVARSVVSNVGGGLPNEYLGYSNTSTSASKSLRIVIGRYKAEGGTGTPRLKVILQSADISAIQFKTPVGGDTFGPTLYGHSGATKAVSVAATPASNAGAIEAFSSRGPATYCWAPVNGTTPSAAVACYDEQLDLAATDGVATTLPGSSGLNPFFGTSAAAPHAAAVAALMLDKEPCRTAAQLIAAQKSTADPISGYTTADQGAGLVDSLAAAGALTACPIPVAPPGSQYVPITPCRVVDTRSGSNTPLGPNVQRGYQVGGNSSAFAAQGGAAGGCGIPEGARAVEASVTAVGPTGTGFFRAWPTGATAPNATFLNYAGGRGITNTGSIALDLTGNNDQDLTVKNFGATADYVIDVQGYFVDPAAEVPTGSVYVPITPCRVVDTRNGSNTPLGPNGQRAYQVGGNGTGFAAQGGASGGCGVPDGARAVEASVTAVGPTATGFFRAWPTGVAAPNATFLNYTGATGITNTGSIALKPAGTNDQDLTVKNFGATADYVIDVQGYFADPDLAPSGSEYVAIAPCRVVDTRAGSGTALGPNVQRGFQVGGNGSGFGAQGGTVDGCAIPEGATAVEASVTAVTPSGTGFFRAWPTGVAAPNATFLNYTSAQGITNTGSIALKLVGADDQDLTVKNFGATADYVVDIQGYFEPGPT